MLKNNKKNSIKHLTNTNNNSIIIYRDKEKGNTRIKLLSRGFDNKKRGVKNVSVQSLI